MKLIDEIDSQKLRGGFYTPDAVVDACLERVSLLLNGNPEVRVLEPSAGDGAFVRGLARTRGLARRSHMTCIESLDEEAQACRAELERTRVAGEVITDSFFHWLRGERGPFNVIVGNPPFIRYQFVPNDDRGLAEWLLAARGHDLHGVSNYWIPFVLLSLDLLRPGGVFSLVLPSELLATVSGGQVRAELIRRFDSLRVDLYPRSTFPTILQDVLILSGVRDETTANARTVTFAEHAQGSQREWQHKVVASSDSWTRYLLTANEWEAFQAARRLPEFQQLRQVATLSVAIVTGANDYFTVDDRTLTKYRLMEWARPLLARTADSPGIIFTGRDLAAAREGGKKCWLLDFSAGRPEPASCQPAASYLQKGERASLHKRYKCRIRSPWYRVPHVQQGAIMMAKRSHQHHRLILNEAGVFTTDTIYRGDMASAYQYRERDLVAAFHNSVTMLSAEVEGRTYGGGVLELVPSEIGRLTVPMIDTRNSIWKVDGISRHTGGQRDPDDRVIEATDALLCERIPGFRELQQIVRDARIRLRDRRFFG